LTVVAARAIWPVTLTHGPVTLRPMRVRDEQAWAEIRQRGFTWFSPWDSTRPPGTRESAMTFPRQVREFAARARRGDMLPFAVDYEPEPGAPAVFCGQVTVSGISYGATCWAQVGYWVDPRWAGRGIIPLAVAIAADHCFSTLGLHRLEVAIRPDNAKSLAVMLKLGFHDDGIRERYMHVRGAWRDHRTFSLMSEDVPEGVVARYERYVAQHGEHSRVGESGADGPTLRPGSDNTEH